MKSDSHKHCQDLHVCAHHVRRATQRCARCIFLGLLYGAFVSDGYCNSRFGMLTTLLHKHCTLVVLPRSA